MIRTMDISHWGKPYANGVLDWNLAAAASPRSIRGIGQDPTTLPEQTIVGQCDFTQGSIVEQIQVELGVEISGYFDAPTCAAWQERFGSPPTAVSLNEAVNLQCASAVVPSCSDLQPRKPVSTTTLLLVGGGVAALGLLMVMRKR